MNRPVTSICATPFASGRWQALVALVMLAMVSGCTLAPQPSCVSQSEMPNPASLCAGDMSFQTHLKPAADGTTAETTNVPSSTTYPPGSFAELLLNVVTTNPEVGIASAGELEAYAGIAMAESAQRPAISLEAMTGPQVNVFSEPPGVAGRSEIGGTFSQQLLDFGASRNDVLRSRATHESATQKRISAAESVALSLVKAVLQLRIAARTVEVLGKNVGQYEQLADVIALNESKGNASMADTERAKSRLERARNQLIDATSDKQQAALELQRIAGFPVSADGFADLDRVLGAMTVPSDLSGSQNPEMLALQKDQEALIHERDSLLARNKPTVSAQLGARYTRNTSSTDDASLNANALLVLAMPVYDGGANQARIDQVSAQLVGVEQKMELLRRQMDAQIENTRQTGAASNGKRTSLAARMAAAQKVAALNFAKYKGGESSLFDLVDSYDDEASAELDLARFDVDQQQLLAEALQLQGKLVSVLLASGRQGAAAQ